MQKLIKKILCICMSIIILVSNANINYIYADETPGGSSGGSGSDVVPIGEHHGDGVWDRFYDNNSLEASGVRLTLYSPDGYQEFCYDVYSKQEGFEGKTITQIEQKGDSAKNIVKATKIVNPNGIHTKADEIMYTDTIPKITNNYACSYSNGWSCLYNGGTGFTQWAKEKYPTGEIGLNLDLLGNAIGHPDLKTKLATKEGLMADGTCYVMLVEPICFMTPNTRVYPEGASGDNIKGLGGAIVGETSKKQIEVSQYETSSFEKRYEYTILDDADWAPLTVKEYGSNDIKSDHNKWSIYVEAGEVAKEELKGLKATLDKLSMDAGIGLKYPALGTGLICAYTTGGSGDGGDGSGGSGTTRIDPNPNTRNLELYDDEISHYYSLSKNSDFGKNRKIQLKVDKGNHKIEYTKWHEMADGTSEAFDYIDYCHKITAGDFFVTVSRVIMGLGECILGKNIVGDGTQECYRVQEGKTITWELGEVDQDMTGYRDVTQDLRTAYPGKNDARTLADLESFGIQESYTPYSELKTQGDGKFNTNYYTQFTVDISGMTDECEGQVKYKPDKDSDYEFAYCEGGHDLMQCSNISAINNSHGNFGMFTQEYEVGQPSNNSSLTYDVGITGVEGSKVKSFNAGGKSFVFKNKYKNVTAGHNYKKFDAIDFYPYVKMTTATVDHKEKANAYILSQNKSSVAEGITVNVGLKEPTDKDAYTLRLNSKFCNWNQATRALNIVSDGKVENPNESIIAGGALTTLYTGGTDRKEEDGSETMYDTDVEDAELCVQAYITCLPDEQCEKVLKYTYSQSQAIEMLEEFKEDVYSNLMDYQVEKYVARGIYTSDSSFDSNAECVYGENQTDRIGNQPLDRTHNKYYFGSGGNNSSSLDVDILSDIEEDDDIESGDHPGIQVLMVKSDTEGNVSLYIDGNVVQTFKGKDYVKHSTITNPTFKELDELNAFVTNYVNALDFDKGKSGRQVGGLGKGWYNEAFDGICCVKASFIYKLGYNTFRQEIVDPALCGSCDDKFDLFNSDKSKVQEKWRTVKYQLSDRPRGGDKGYLGTIADMPVYCKNMQDVLTSPLYYYANATVQDLDMN